MFWLSVQEQEALNPLSNVEYAELYAIPLMLGDDCLGVVNCYTSTPLHIRDEDQLVLRALGHHVALAIDHYHRVEGEEREQQQKHIHAFMNDLLRAAVSGTEAALQRRGYAFGCNLTALHVLISLHLLPLLRDSVAMEDERHARISYAATQVKRLIHEHYPGSLIDGGDEHLVCLLRLQTERAVDEVSMLAAYDGRKHTDLLGTLGMYLECGTNIAQTSSQLHVHRNTVLQRLERIQSLCKVDLEQQTNRLPLLVAVKLYQAASHATL